MPATSIRFDVPNRVWLDTTGGSLGSLSAKREDIVRYEVGLIYNGLIMDLPDDAVLTLSVKDPASPSGDYMSTATGQKSGSAIFARWAFDLALNTEAVDTFLGSSTISKPSNAELVIVRTGFRLASPFLPFNIEPDINRLDSSVASPIVAYLFRPDLTSLTAIAAGISTVGLVTGSVVETILTVGSTRGSQKFELQAGPYDNTDSDNQRNPADYNATTNNRHWSAIA